MHAKKSQAVIVETAVEEILTRRTQIDPRRSALIGVSGIDAAGKGYITDQIVERLQRTGIRAVALHGDGWLNSPDKRFNMARAAEHFYENALRFEQMFGELVLPLKQKRSHRGTMDFVSETAATYTKQTYAFSDVDVLILECIFLFKNEFRRHFDLSIWIDCSFQTALERAVGRSQEGLGVNETVSAYQTIYFPAQRIHFDKDLPRSTADLIIDNG
jgi:uridine kinase